MAVDIIETLRRLRGGLMANGIKDAPSIVLQSREDGEALLAAIMVSPRSGQTACAGVRGWIRNGEGALDIFIVVDGIRVQWPAGPSNWPSPLKPAPGEPDVIPVIAETKEIR